MATKRRKKIKTLIKLNILAGKANPAPPIGPALGQHGVPIMDFCKEFNAKTGKLGDDLIPAVITVYEDRSFTFITKTPITSSLILKAIQKDKGSSMPNKEKVGTISRKALEEIAEIKMPDLNANSLEEAVKVIAGTAKSMGIEIEK